MFSVIWKFIKQVWVYILGILGGIGILLNPLSNYGFWGISGEKIICLVVLFVVMLIYIKTEIENRKRPDIKIKPIVANGTAILEIHNNGGISKFNVKAKILNDYNHLNNIYTLLWEPEGDRAEIGKDGIGKIDVAYQAPITLKPVFMMGLKMPILTNEGKKLINLAIWPLGEMGQIRTDKPPDDICLELSIMADKNMGKKFSRLIFKLSQKSITDLQFEYVKSKARKLKLDKDGYWK